MQLSKLLFRLSLSLLLLESNAPAWDATGHRIIAAIAYQRLTPQVRQRVDALLEQHPDYASHFILNAPPDPAGRARAAFLAAAVWPDQLRSDRRFYDETKPDAVPTPQLPGFPDMKVHNPWHYYDVPYAPDGAQPKKPAPENALEEFEHLTADLTNPYADLIFDLPWLEHIDGDIHQPLHCTSRYLKSQPDGDQGGNLVFVVPGRNLHAVWDNSPGTDTSDAYVTDFAAKVTSDFPQPHHLDLNPRHWVDESFKLDKRDVYTFGLETGTREHPLPLPQGYVENAQRIARERIAMAGYRLAAILNQKLK